MSTAQEPANDPRTAGTHVDPELFQLLHGSQSSAVEGPEPVAGPVAEAAAPATAKKVVTAKAAKKPLPKRKAAPAVKKVAPRQDDLVHSAPPSPPPEAATPEASTPVRGAVVTSARRAVPMTGKTAAASPRASVATERRFVSPAKRDSAARVPLSAKGGPSPRRPATARTPTSPSPASPATRVISGSSSLNHRAGDSARRATPLAFQASHSTLSGFSSARVQPRLNDSVNDIKRCAAVRAVSPNTAAAASRRRAEAQTHQLQRIRATSPEAAAASKSGALVLHSNTAAAAVRAPLSRTPTANGVIVPLRAKSPEVYRRFGSAGPAGRGGSPLVADARRNSLGLLRQGTDLGRPISVSSPSRAAVPQSPGSASARSRLAKRAEAARQGSISVTTAGPRGRSTSSHGYSTGIFDVRASSPKAHGRGDHTALADAARIISSLQSALQAERHSAVEVRNAVRKLESASNQTILELHKRAMVAEKIAGELKVELVKLGAADAVTRIEAEAEAGSHAEVGPMASVASLVPLEVGEASTAGATGPAANGASSSGHAAAAAAVSGSSGTKSGRGGSGTGTPLRQRVVRLPDEDGEPQPRASAEVKRWPPAEHCSPPRAGSQPSGVVGRFEAVSGTERKSPLGSIVKQPSPLQSAKTSEPANAESLLAQSGVLGAAVGSTSLALTPSEADAPDAAAPAADEVQAPQKPEDAAAPSPGTKLRMLEEEFNADLQQSA